MNDEIRGCRLWALHNPVEIAPKNLFGKYTNDPATRSRSLPWEHIDFSSFLFLVSIFFFVVMGSIILLKSVGTDVRWLDSTWRGRWCALCFPVFFFFFIKLHKLVHMEIVSICAFYCCSSLETTTYSRREHISSSVMYLCRCRRRQRREREKKTRHGQKNCCRKCSQFGHYVCSGVGNTMQLVMRSAQMHWDKNAKKSHSIPFFSSAHFEFCSFFNFVFLASTNGKIDMLHYFIAQWIFHGAHNGAPSICYLVHSPMHTHAATERETERRIYSAGFRLQTCRSRAINNTERQNDGENRTRYASTSEKRERKKKSEQIMQSKLDQQREDALASWNGGGNTMKIRTVRDSSRERERKSERARQRWEAQCEMANKLPRWIHFRVVHESFAFASRTMAWTAEAAAAARCHSGRTECQERPNTHTQVINMPGDDDAMPLFISESRALAFT